MSQNNLSSNYLNTNKDLPIPSQQRATNISFSNIFSLPPPNATTINNNNPNNANNVNNNAIMNVNYLAMMQQREKNTISAEVTSVNTASNNCGASSLNFNNNNINSIGMGYNSINMTSFVNNSTINILQQIFDKVRTLCKQCNLADLPIKLSINDITSYFLNPNPSPSIHQPSPLTTYIASLDSLRTKIHHYTELQQQYKKLEAILQKNQTQIRKHIAIQQQFKLYVDTLKAQYEQSENQRIQLLENSKTMIKQIKLENQKLYQEICNLRGNGASYEEFGKQYHSKDNKNRDQDQKKQKDRISQLKSKQHSKKHIPNLKNKQRLKSQYCSSLNVNHNRNLTEGTFITPGKEKFRITQNRQRHQLTQRPQNSKKRKLGDLKKRQNYTVMAYMSHKKKQSKQKDRERQRQRQREREKPDREKQKSNIKKTLISFSDKKQVNFSQLKNNKQNSDKKVHRSILSLQSIDYNDEQQ